MAMCKNYTLTPKYVLNMSYANVMMYSSALPSYDLDKKDNTRFDSSKDANIPGNFTEEVIRR